MLEYSPNNRILPRYPGDLYGVRKIDGTDLWAVWFAAFSYGWSVTPTITRTVYRLIGVYDTQKQAALTYNIYALAKCGKFALLNEGITMTKEETKAWLNNLTLQQVMALASQHKVKEYLTLSRKKLTNRLLQIKNVTEPRKV